MNDKASRIPILDPLILALKSRRVIVAIATLLVSLLIFAVPELEVVQSEILLLLTVLALAVIGGYSVEDAAAAGRTDTAEVTIDLEQNVRDLINTTVDEFFSKRLLSVQSDVASEAFRRRKRISEQLHGDGLPATDTEFSYPDRREVETPDE